ncbi:hypothetical protein [Halorubrum trueperi]|uniref:Ribbon-helix-helix protein, CopG family n=1 Tax=Halorubrum trueperi TaxID=2004704 RepID=A0ABD5UI19_9EURY
MTDLNISGITDAEVEEIEQRVDESGASSRSEWLRRRLRAGITIYDAGEINEAELDRLVIGDE